MISDNGSTYSSAAEELHFLMQLPEVKEELGKKGISWRFIPIVWVFLGMLNWAHEDCHQEGAGKVPCPNIRDRHC